ncbi:MAG: trigger factor [Tissierellia bacterium]|nr:trigger factor [Tissierellia bacterium]
MAKLINKEGYNVEFEMELTPEEIKKAEDIVFKKTRHQFTIPGFRKGHAPRKLIENMYGKGLFFEDAVNELLPEAYRKAVEELDLDVIDQPTIEFKEDEEIEENKPVVLNVKVDVRPEFETIDYKSIEIEPVEKELTDEDIEQAIEREQKSLARMISVDDRPVEEGDTLNIDYKGTIDGEAFEGGTAEGQSLVIGSNTFIPGFEDQLIGKNLGDTVEVKTTFPEDYHAEELAGKEAVFETTINEISYEELPKVDDEFVKDISEFDTLEEYKADLTKKLQESKENYAKNEENQKIMEKVAELMTQDIPNGMIESAIDNQIDNFARQLQMQGMDLKQFTEMTGQDPQKFRDTFREGAINSLKVEIGMDTIAKAEKIEATDAEVDEKIKEMAEEFFPNDEAEQKKFAEGLESKEYFKEMIVREKTMDFMRELAIKA